MSESTAESTMSRPTRRAVMKGVAAWDGIAAVGEPAGNVFAASRNPDDGHDGPRANVLLAPGVWVDGSSWSRVIPILQAGGHEQAPGHEGRGHRASEHR
jgi:hypothetical protein